MLGGVPDSDVAGRDFSLRLETIHPVWWANFRPHEGEGFHIDEGTGVGDLPDKLRSAVANAVAARVAGVRGRGGECRVLRGACPFLPVLMYLL